MEIKPPHVDGEKIPAQEIRRIFQPPPGIAPIRRNTLLVGARGAGKTTLLSYLAASEGTTSVYVSLVDIVGGVAKDTVPAGAGGLENTQVFERQQARSTCYLIAWFLSEARKYGWLPPYEDAASHLPTSMCIDGANEWESFFHNLDKRIPSATLDIDAVRLINERSPLKKVATLIGSKVSESGGTLKLLFDRADAIPLPCALPVLELLDQDGPYLVLVATRPAPHADLDWGVQTATGTMADDQYDVVALGAAPRSTEWRSFVKKAVGAQLAATANLPNSLFDSILYFSADSVRLALQLTHSVLSEVDVSDTEALNIALEFRQSQLLNRAKARLKAWQHSFTATKIKWREQVVRTLEGRGLNAPVHITVHSRRERDLWSDTSVPQTLEDRFIAACLEDSLLRPPHGEYWFPGARFSSLEVSPLLMWERSDGLAPGFTQPIEVTMSAGEFLGGGGGGPSPLRGGQIFVGLRFTFQSSVDFFRELRDALSKHPMLGKIVLRNGKLPSGAKWAVEIRDLITKSTLGFIGDVTGGRGDVLFELGIAYGLGRTIIPVVEQSSDISRCTYWLRSYNIGVYGTPAGRAELVASIFDHVYRRKRPAKDRLPAPVPHVLGFIGEHPWCTHHVEQLRNLVAKEGGQVEVITKVTESNYEEAVQLACRASLLVLSLNDTDQDAFAHFAAGIVAARPSAGFGNRPLQRVAVILPESRDTGVPDGITRAQPYVTIAYDGSAYLAEVRNFLRSYANWRR